ncbi:TetR family transcriptional regulator [Halobacillus halophilus]|uniref:TetR family transcription regulator n=1 Tax=Halobacillus halophilus (strain ATCC 35676 / DSM 2266 / JCM 20832 / KCTC 3685 / LMG 17431 / NBRC 102448 / NCIMB 2269) TaxID=866895 RepID=I0JLL9_HALH3|nr:TetR/AcrR family transcriptional regulator [Halobacillus halophilus]ASF39146.1 TetR family transcriptional regulator [Halobacillus halophilus]CCG45039.1 TetR family transcription regulator [Halobacillus halophilus DSM 2266]
MEPKFLALEQEKQDRILNAAMKEFAQNGYKNTSTNNIVKQAGISKGLLFHYFTNKRELYLTLYDYFVELFLKEMQQKVDWEDKDIFSRHRQIAALKIKLFHQYEHIFNFLNAAMSENSREVKSELDSRKEKFINHNYREMLQDIDKSKFKEGLDVSKIIEIISWSMEGFAYKQQAKFKGLSINEMDLEETLQELDGYIEVLKYSFYK